METQVKPTVKAMSDLQPTLFDLPKEPPPFYNTIKLSGPILDDAKKCCSKQEQRILDLIGNVARTPFEVLELYKKTYPEVPITSIRRAMTNLTDKKFLEKLAEMKDERFGKPNFLWRKVK